MGVSPWTPEELEAMRLADEEIEREFDEDDYYVADKNLREIDSWLDELTVLDRMDHQSSHQRNRQKQYLSAYRAANKEKIAVQKAAYRKSHKAEIAAKDADYYKAHKEDISARKKAYRAANKEKIAVQKAAYRKSHKTEIAAKMAAYRAANKEKIAAYKKAYRKAHKGK